jgi:opacity protein-like surface antigen
MKSPGYLPATLVVLAMLSCAGSAFAQNQTDRAGKWEGHFNVLYGDSQNVSSDRGSSADIDGDFGWGFGFGYNFNDHFALEGNFSWMNSDYSATIVPDAGGSSQTINGTLETSTLAVNATYNLLARNLTPFVTGGIGSTWVDTNIPDGPATPVCWWDPWWGYYCAPAYPTKSDNYFSYNAGVGVRWDSKGTLFLRGLVSQQWVDVGGGVGTPSFTQIRVDIGTRF